MTIAKKLIVIVLFFSTFILFLLIKINLRNTKKINNNVLYTVSSNRQPDLLLVNKQNLLNARTTAEGNSNLISQKTLNYIKKKADEALNGENFSVADDTIIPPSGDKHDYISLAPFYWQKKLSNGEIIYEQKDAKVNPERAKYVDEDYFYEMIDRVYLLTIASYISDDLTYAYKAKELLSVWILQENTQMNPNFEFAQYVPGTNKGTGGSMDAKNLAVLMDSVALLNDLSILSKFEKAGLDTWFADLYKWAINSDIQLNECRDVNNHGTWCDVLYLSLAIYNNDYEYGRKIIDKAKKRIASHFNSNGEQPKEITRADSLHYHLFNLEGYNRLAIMAEKLNIDLWNYQTEKGAGIKKGLNYLIPFLKGEKKWPGNQLNDKESQLNLHNEIISLYQKAYYYTNEIQYKELLKEVKKPDESDDFIDILYPI